jgi:flagellar protein FliO/FliZ
LPNATDTLAAAPDLGYSSIFTMAGALFLILGLLYAAYWLLRRFGTSGLGLFPGARGSAGPNLLARLALGPRQHVVVVRVLGKTLVLGVTESRISLLCEAEPGAVPELELISPQPASFCKTLAALLKGKRHDDAD